MDGVNNLEESFQDAIALRIEQVTGRTISGEMKKC
jgi:hypothetical protein